jgi:hypothetical protein
LISFDTNIVFTALAANAVGHVAARDLIRQHQDSQRVVLCELMLAEVYTLLRNPRVCPRPMNGTEAAAVVQALRHHPVWRVVDYEPKIADSLWKLAAQHSFPYRRLYDARLALTLRHHGVTDFATRNVKDFQGFGFARIWDPIGEHTG